MQTMISSCCFTGHRNISSFERTRIQEQLESEIVQLIHQGVYGFFCGGALGFDTLAALAVLKIREIYTHIKLIMVLPCRDQAERWSDRNRGIYDRILNEADEVIYTAEHYYNGCMLRRNRRLVDSSDVCICYLAKTSGGTAYTIAYAKERGLRVINLARG